jgi:hypothetical protein
VSLYNCKSLPNQAFRMSKFDEDFNFEASYELTAHGCPCFQGNKPDCRHRKMVRAFVAANAVDSDLFIDYENWKFIRLKPVGD